MKYLPIHESISFKSNRQISYDSKEMTMSQGYFKEESLKCAIPIM